MKLLLSTSVTSVSSSTRFMSGWPAASASLNWSRMLCGSATPEFSSTILQGSKGSRQESANPAAHGMPTRYCIASASCCLCTSHSLLHMHTNNSCCYSHCTMSAYCLRLTALPSNACCCPAHAWHLLLLLLLLAHTPGVGLAPLVSQRHNLLKRRKQLILEVAACMPRRGTQAGHKSCPKHVWQVCSAHRLRTHGLNFRCAFCCCNFPIVFSALRGLSTKCTAHTV